MNQPETLNQVVFWIMCGVIVAMQALIILLLALVAYFAKKKIDTLDGFIKDLYERSDNLTTAFADLHGQHKVNHGLE